MLESRYGTGPAVHTCFVPGRVNLIGEHIDYHGLPVLPMAIGRGLHVAFRKRNDASVLCTSKDEPSECSFNLGAIAPGPEGDWTNYLKAAARAALDHWRIRFGIEAAVVSDLPSAAGLSSSSALLIASSIALLAVNEVPLQLTELMSVLPEAEYFVGTRGGGMDHAAILAAEPGCALHISFHPFTVTPVPIPSHWRFLVAHSLTTARKSAALKDEYNCRRFAGCRALERSGAPSYASLLESGEKQMPEGLNDWESSAFRHVLGEGRRVKEAITALEGADYQVFGSLLNDSHASLRDLLRASIPALDEIVETAKQTGAGGARVTGAGFGGCAIVLCRTDSIETVRNHLVDRYYSGKPGFDPEKHLFIAEPSAGALFRQQ